MEALHNDNLPQDTWKMTGKNLQQIKKAVDQFQLEQKQNLQLKQFRILDYQLENDFIVPQKRILYIKGRNETIYENKMFKFRLEFTDRFPQMPPLLYCQNFSQSKKVQNNKYLQHPNIFADDGQVCHMLLNKKRKAPLLSKILVAIQELLYKPNLLSCANETMGKFYAQIRKKYDQKAQQDAKNLLDQDQKIFS